jgi:hypothetical protein
MTLRVYIALKTGPLGSRQNYTAYLTLGDVILTSSSDPQLAKLRTREDRRGRP